MKEHEVAELVNKARKEICEIVIGYVDPWRVRTIIQANFANLLLDNKGDFSGNKLE